MYNNAELVHMYIGTLVQGCDENEREYLLSRVMEFGEANIVGCWWFAIALAVDGLRELIKENIQK